MSAPNLPRGGAAERVGLLLAALLAGFAAAEGVVRLVLPAPQIVRFEPLANPGERSTPGTLVVVPTHPDGSGLFLETDSGRRLRPNTFAVVENHALSKRRVEIRTNSIGYRNAEIGPKQGRRILFLGDSITFGDYLPEEETFVRLVEQRARAGGQDWETINAGVGAISLKNELAILQETGLALEPDVVVLGFYLNDFQESPGVYVLPLPGFLRWSHLAHYAAMGLSRLRPAPTSLADTASAQVEAWREEFMAGREFARGDPREDRAAFDAAIARRFDDWGGAWSPHAWAAMEPLLVYLKELSAQHGFELLIAAFPVRLQVDAEALVDEPQQYLRALASGLGVPVLDLLPALRRAYRKGDGDLFFDHCHHTSLGNEVVADELVRFLENHLD